MKKNDPWSRGTAEGRKEGRKKWFWSGDGLAEVARPPRGRAPPLVVPEQSVSLENGRALASERASEGGRFSTDGRTKAIEGGEGEGISPICLCPEQTHFEPIGGRRRAEPFRNIGRLNSIKSRFGRTGCMSVNPIVHACLSLTL